MALSSATVSVRGPRTPSTASAQASRLATMETSGAGRLLRMYRRSLGVTTLVPNALRLVSMVVAVCWIRCSGFFQLTYAGKGFAAEVAAAEAGAAGA